jgi:hypothetical protein
VVVFASGAVGVLARMIEDRLSEFTHNVTGIIRKSRRPCSRIALKSAALKIRMKLIYNECESGWQVETGAFGVSGRPIEIVTDLRTVPSVGACGAEQMRFE